MATAPRAVLVTRPSELEHLVARHGTRGQARFALEARDAPFGEVEARHHAFEAALTEVSRAIPSRWRTARIERADLPRFVWEPGDVVLAVGQDGLVANVAKYLDGQLVIGIDPDRARFDGVLVRHPVEAVGVHLARAIEGAATIEERTLVETRTDDGQSLLAPNEVYVGHRSHQSSRYRIDHAGAKERQSSSSVIVATGTGATGWARSIARERKGDFRLPAPTEPAVAFFVREASPSATSATELTHGVVLEGSSLEIASEIEEGGVVFGDGLEEDRLRIGWGARIRLGVARRRLRLVV